MAHWREHLSIGIHEVAYEDMVAGTEAETRKLLEFCGLAWDDAVLKPHETTGTVLTASNWQVRKPVYTSAVGRWKNYEKHLGPMIDEVGPYL